MVERNEQKAEITYQYFKDINIRMRTDLHYKVLLRYKLWQDKKRKKRMEAEAKKLNAKKTNKYGNKIKKAGTTVKLINAITKPVSKLNPSTTSVTSAPVNGGGSEQNLSPTKTDEGSEHALHTSQTLKVPNQNDMDATHKSILPGLSQQADVIEEGDPELENTNSKDGEDDQMNMTMRTDMD